jgi:hypothetical protein
MRAGIPCTCCTEQPAEFRNRPDEPSGAGRRLSGLGLPSACSRRAPRRCRAQTSPSSTVTLGVIRRPARLPEISARGCPRAGGGLCSGGRGLARCLRRCRGRAAGRPGGLRPVVVVRVAWPGERRGRVARGEPGVDADRGDAYLPRLRRWWDLGNRATHAFTVAVRGPVEQLAEIRPLIVGVPGAGASLSAQLTTIRRLLGVPPTANTACAPLESSATAVRSLSPGALPTTSRTGILGRVARLGRLLRC